MDNKAQRDLDVDRIGATLHTNDNLDTLYSSSPTKGSVIITELPEEVVRSASENMNSKGPYLRAAKLTRTAAKDVIAEALDFLDKEAEQLRSVNNSYIVENSKIKEENEKLKKELDDLRLERATMLRNMEKFEVENVKLKDDIRNHVEKFKEVKKKSENVHNKLLEENAKFVKQIENLRKEATIREAQLNDKAQELEQLKEKLKEMNRRNKSDRLMELLHEVEVLKSQRRNLYQERGATLKENKNLREEMNNLENTLETKISELNNENRRHFLLTKEFNSLLEENNRLKQHIRSRNPPGTPNGTRQLNTSIPASRTRQLTAENVDLVPGYAENQSPTSRRSNTQMSLPARRRPSNPNLMARTHTTVLDTNSVTSSSSKVTQDDISWSEAHNSLPSLATKKGNWKP